MPISVGIGIFTGQLPENSPMTFADDYEATLKIASLADEIGFDSIWFSEHHCAPDGYLPSLPVMMAAVAAVTTRLRIGTGILLAPFQHPLRFAEDCAVIDQISRGRLILGLGNGWREEDFAPFSIPMNERFIRTIELIEICRAAWYEKSFTYQGQQQVYRDVSIMPRPFGTIPILLGGHADAAIARAGRIADGYIAAPRSSQGIANSVISLSEKVATFDAGAASAGKDPRDLDLVFCTNVWVSADDALPPAVLDAIWYRYCTAMVLRETPDHPYIMPPPDEQMIRDRALIGTPQSVLNQLRPWIDAFPGRKVHLVFRLHYPGMTFGDAEEAIQLFAAQVIPQLKSM